MILDIINKEIDRFNKPITLIDKWKFNQKERVRKNYLYYNSQYESGQFDDQGDKKYFHNINRNPCNVASKAIDFDTKDIKVQTAGGGNPLRTWLFERDLKYWMKEQGFGKVLNRIFRELPIFGSVVLKIINGKPYFVDLRNFIVDQSADTLKKASYIIEVHNYFPVEFKQVAKEKKWKNVKKVLKEFKETDQEFIRVFERFGEVDGEYKRVVHADIGKDIQDGEETHPHPGFTLDEGKVDDIPYWEFHWEKMSGRWLGVGRVEILTDSQIRVNEISNQQAKSSYCSTLRLWQTRDEGINRNLLTDVDNGEILNVDSEISQIDMADRNLAYYNQEIQRWLSNRDEMTFSYDVNRGERLPAGTPLGSAQLAAGMASSYFNQIRENIAMDIKELLFKVIIPSFKNKNRGEHYLRLVGEDLNQYNNFLIREKSTNMLFEYIAKNQRIPSSEEFKVIQSVVSEKVKQGKEKIKKIPAGFYKDLKYKIDIIITGESLDTRVESANLMAAIQAVTTDPTLLPPEAKRKLFRKFLEQGGISVVDLGAEDSPDSLTETAIRGGQTKEGAMQGAGRAGGGVSRVNMPQTSVGGRVEATV